MRLPSFVLLLIGLSTLWAFASNNPKVSIQRVTPEGGITYSQVTSIVEDDNGFIWYSTLKGLFYYNGVEIKRYSHLKNDPSTISSNRINQLFKDEQGKIWAATQNGLCSYNPKSDDFTRYNFISQFNKYIGHNIRRVFKDENSQFWFLDERGVGTLTIKNKTANYKTVTSKTNSVRYATLDGNNTIWIFYEDGEIYFKPTGTDAFEFFGKGMEGGVWTVLFDNDLLWIGYSTKGLLCFNRKSGAIVKHFSADPKNIDSKIPSNQVRSLIKGYNNEIWAATYRGIAIINDLKVTHVIDKEKYAEIPYNSIWSLYKDSQKNIWIGTWMGGLAFNSERNKSFQRYRHTASKKSLSNNIVSCFEQTPDGSSILVGMDDGDLNVFDPKKNEFHTKYIVNQNDTIRNIKSLVYDENGTLWVGTYINGILYQQKNQKEFKRLTPPFETGFQAYGVLPVKDGIWVNDYPSGVYHYSFISKKFTRYMHNPLDINSISNNQVKQIVQDKNENLWFATENGLNVLRKGSVKFEHFFHQESNSNSISFNHINCLYLDSNDYLWIGTNGQGLDRFDPNTGQIKHYTYDQGLGGFEVFSILEDQKQNLWVTTENGLCKLNPFSDEITFFNKNSGLGNNHFYPKAALSSLDGDFYFGGSNGILRFSPDQIERNLEPPKTTIIQLLVNNKKISPSDDSGILDDVIEKSTFLKLDHNQNYISFLFTSNNFVTANRTKFKYRLVNFNDQWINTDFTGRASFTNVPPGNYIFEVKAANNNAIWNSVPYQIFIEISPPLWQTWYAYLTYLLLFIAAVYFFRRLTIKGQKLKSEVAMSKVLRETEENLHQMKLQFFTNISHEFRTPLTLIQGPVNRLIKAGTNSDISRKQLNLIKNNTDRLLRLINQFLDFRRIDNNKLKINSINTDIVVFCKNVFDCFEEHAKHRNIRFNFLSSQPVLRMDFDTDKIDKLLVNLISNAFKYSPDDSPITLQIKHNVKSKRNENWSNYTIGEPLDNDFVEISISDSGYGIPSEKLPKIFERFFQIEEDNSIGTGIGLALTTNYIALHKGQIAVYSSEGKGTVFYIYLPLHQKGHAQIDPEIKFNPFVAAYSSESILDVISTQARTENQDALILIAEDNSDLLEFLLDSLNGHYKVAKAKNGKDAYDLALSLNPDLIISDIMMPRMNGMELCNKIKNDIHTSHIPVILLTALDSIKDQIAGIGSGADAYISKPFSEEFLIVQINSLLQSRKVLRNLYTVQREEWNESTDILSLDKRLLATAVKLVEKNITNTSFTIENLASGLNLSRSHLHRKLKSLTGQSATEFIRDIRLKNAVELMNGGNLMIKEIGYAVGFNSQNYFTKAFKKKYGITPTEFVKKKAYMINDDPENR